MILIAGGTGALGTRLVRVLTERGTPVRVLTRRRARAEHLTGDLVDVAVGDVRDAAAVAAAVAGVDVVVSAVQGVAGVQPAGVVAVDGDGNRNLLRAASVAGLRRFVLISAVGASPDSSLELRRMKFAAEQAVVRAGLPWTVIRPTAFMETWSALMGAMAAKKGSVTVFGRGDNPINFVSADDVAVLAARAIIDPQLAGLALDVGGPEDLTLNDVARRILISHHRPVRIRHIPRPVLRGMSAVLRPVRPQLAALPAFGVLMDTTTMTLQHDTARERVPDIPSTTLDSLLAGRNPGLVAR